MIFFYSQKNFFEALVIAFSRNIEIKVQKAIGPGSSTTVKRWASKFKGKPYRKESWAPSVTTKRFMLEP
ncbi:MAG: hypothetical protein ACR2KB_09045 [Chitinophagaceae bacterium]